MIDSPKKAAVLWTGGKDSCLALYRAREAGFQIACLCTFVPKAQDFRAHSIDRMKEQAIAIGLPIHFLTVVEPYRESYISQLQLLQTKFEINTPISIR